MDVSAMNMPAVTAQQRLALPASPAVIALNSPYLAVPGIPPGQGKTVLPPPENDPGRFPADRRNRSARFPGDLDQPPSPGAARRASAARTDASGAPVPPDRTLEGMAEAVQDRLTIGSRKPEESGGSLLAYSRFDRSTVPAPAVEGEAILAQAEGITDRVTITGSGPPARTAESAAEPEMQVLVGIRGRAALAYALAP